MKKYRVKPEVLSKMKKILKYSLLTCIVLLIAIGVYFKLIPHTQEISEVEKQC